MRLPSRLPALLAAASVATAGLGAPAVTFGQSAGDQQYQDPLAGSTTSTGSGSPAVPDPSTGPQLSSTTPTGAGDPTLPSLPPLSSGTGASGSSSPGSGAAAKSPAAATATQLPNTGLDGRILAGLGLGMLLCGIGLRLRTARERF